MTRPTQSRAQASFNTVGETETEGSPAKTQPRVWEEQGSPAPEPQTKQPSPTNRYVQSPASRTPQPVLQGTRPAANPARPVQAVSEPQPKPASPLPQRQQTSHPPAPKPESATAPAPKKGH
jgi:hypothetical protein